MAELLPFEMLPQPDATTCGPTCLHALYRYYGDQTDLSQVISEVSVLSGGGTLAVFLACHALRRGYRATIYTYNLQLFDPMWFGEPPIDLRGKLAAQVQVKADLKLHEATDGYLEFLDLGGTVRFQDLTTKLVRKYLTQGRPILTGLSATYLYHASREYGEDGISDDVQGFPVGHFVVLCGYEREERDVLVADPLHPNPMAAHHTYPVSIDRVLGAVLLGIVTYDANLLILEPPARRQERRG